MFEQMKNLISKQKLINSERAGKNKLIDDCIAAAEALRQTWDAECNERESQVVNEMQLILREFIGQVAVEILLLGGMNGSRPRELKRYLPWYQASSIVTWTYNNGGHMFNGRLYLPR